MYFRGLIFILWPVHIFAVARTSLLFVATTMSTFSWSNFVFGLRKTKIKPNEKFTLYSITHTSCADVINKWCMHAYMSEWLQYCYRFLRKSIFVSTASSSQLASNSTDIQRLAAWSQTDYTLFFVSTSKHFILYSRDESELREKISQLLLEEEKISAGI